MKKTTTIFKSIIAIAAVTFFISCKKEIERPQNNLSGSEKAISAAQVANPLTMPRTAIKKPGFFIPDSTLTK